MMDCNDFEKIQVAALLGDATPGRLKKAARHAGECEDCDRHAALDRRLEAALARDETTPRGFGRAHQALHRLLKERRVFCGVIETPIGSLFLARTDRGLCRVSFRGPLRTFMQEFEDRHLLPEVDPSKLDVEVQAFAAYFARRRRTFSVSLDLCLASPFQRRVLEVAAEIPYGSVASYGELARRIGQPEAPRAVGGALGKNPVPIIIPCHRVVAAGGRLGGYSGGLGIKRRLMEIEGIPLSEVRA
jgi:methylated-DNA-[protein]-cysteine S-methyltransferase